MTQITTERLLLRPFGEEDRTTFRRIHGDAGLTARMHRGALDAAEANQLFADYQAAFAKDGFGVRAITLKGGDGEMIGECGLWFRETAGGYTLRYMLVRPWWGQGLSGEAARACVAEGFGPLGLKVIHAIAMDGNEHSVRVLKSLGMVKIEDSHRGIAGFGRYVLTPADFRHLG
ncbi:MAG: GNAT family N-acetyltransferase [Rhodospirillaceae bacterium]